MFGDCCYRREFKVVKNGLCTDEALRQQNFVLWRCNCFFTGLWSGTGSLQVSPAIRSALSCFSAPLLAPYVVLQWMARAMIVVCLMHEKPDFDNAGASGERS
ncbi:uncharacterized protein SPSK_10929 [Sporothrix schenckii 1099-18]|uniref:Uncharacterized protein n=1 Tax=Sporothrix schenckii 1099-18 TaxID=1397361 RepID=A0A0F2M5P1_SPOSC|nr:uncharacterized protein SPSK_10929 [Sporothrix schenckii 1099-18]KJR84932.1 hypothetical protein SPSK_10929 [Sporothrix schenckii 1099-18]